MRFEMKYATAFLALMVVAGCNAQHGVSAKKSVGMPNPASVYCQEKGGKLEMVEMNSGTVGYCVLPNGERIEEWALYRRDHNQS